MQDNKYYKVKLATANSMLHSGWQEYTKFIYTFSDNININGSMLNQSIYANNIVIQNTTINQNIDVVASQSITILPNTTITSGSFRIEDIGCSSATTRRMNSNSTYSGKSSADISYNGNSNNTTNINDPDSIITKEKDVSFYPNPNNGTFTISVQGINDVIGYVEIRDILSNVVCTDKLSQNKYPVDLSKVQNGVYFIKVNIAGECYIGKIIKQ